MRPFDPTESAEFLVAGQPDGGVFIQGGCFYTEDKQFVRVSESRRHLFEAWLATQKQVEIEVRPPVKLIPELQTPPARRKFKQYEAQKIKKSFVDKFGQAEWDALPKGDKTHSAAELLS